MHRSVQTDLSLHVMHVSVWAHSSNGTHSACPTVHDPSLHGHELTHIEVYTLLLSVNQGGGERADLCDEPVL